MAERFGKDFLKVCEDKHVRIVLMGSKEAMGEPIEFAHTKLGAGNIEGKLVGYGERGLILDRDERSTFVSWQAVAMIEMLG